MKKSFLKYFISMVSYTNRLIFATICLFFLFLILFAVNPETIKFVELNPEFILSGKYLWTLLTSVFMHQGGLHLFVNMISLFFLGNLSEQIIGRKRFLILYFIAGIVGGIFFVLGAWFGSFFGLENVFGSMGDYAAGASGALFGLLGVLAVLIPRYRVYLVAGPLIILVIEIIALQFIPEKAGTFFELLFGILMLLSIFGMFSRNAKLRKLAMPIGLSMWVAPIIAIVPLVIVSFFIRLPIGNTAHLGGLVVGVIYGIALRLKYPKKIAFLERILRR